MNDLLHQWDVIEWRSDNEHERRVQRVVLLEKEFRRTGVIDIIIGTSRVLITVPYWISLDDVYEAISEGKVSIVPDAYSIKIRTDDEYYTKHADQTSKNWSIIQPVLFDEEDNIRSELFDPDLRRMYIVSAVRKGGPDEKRVRKLLTQAMQGRCSKMDVVPNHYLKGAPGKARQAGEKKRGRPNLVTEVIGENGRNIGPIDLENIKATAKLLQKGRFSSNRQAYLWFLSTFYSRGIENKEGVSVPQLPPFSERISEENFSKLVVKFQDSMQKIIGKYGRHYYNTKSRPIEGSAFDRPLNAGSLLYIDSTIPLVPIVDEKTRSHFLGYPTLFISMDGDTGMPAGFISLLRKADYVGAMVLLDVTNMDKAEFAKSLGLEIPSDIWPWHGIASNVYADRAELLGRTRKPDNAKSDRWVQELNIGMGNAPRERPDMKGMLEGIIAWLEENGIKTVPGYPDARIFRRTQKDVLRGAVTLRELNQILFWLFVQYIYTVHLKKHPLYSAFCANDMQPVAAEIFNFAVANYSGSIRRFDRDFLRKAILPKEGGAIHLREGVYFKQMYYTSQQARDENWFIDKGSDRPATREVDVLFDPRLVDRIYVRRRRRDGKLEDWIEFELRQDYLTRYGGLSFAEAEKVRRIEKQAERLGRTYRDQYAVETQAQIDEITRRAMSAKRQLQTTSSDEPPTQKERLDPRHAADARTQENLEGAWVGPALPTESPASVEEQSMKYLKARAAESRLKQIAAMKAAQEAKQEQAKREDLGA